MDDPGVHAVIGPACRTAAQTPQGLYSLQVAIAGERLSQVDHAVFAVAGNPSGDRRAGESKFGFRAMWDSLLLPPKLWWWAIFRKKRLPEGEL